MMAGGFLVYRAPAIYKATATLRLAGERRSLTREIETRRGPRRVNLADVVARVLPYWHDVIAPQLLVGQNVLIVAHGNSLRALLMHLEHVSRDDIAELNIPTAVPRRYRFDDALRVSNAQYLGDQQAIAAAAAQVAAQSRA